MLQQETPVYNIDLDTAFAFFSLDENKLDTASIRKAYARWLLTHYHEVGDLEHPTAKARRLALEIPAQQARRVVLKVYQQRALDQQVDWAEVHGLDPSLNLPDFMAEICLGSFLDHFTTTTGELWFLDSLTFFEESYGNGVGFFVRFFNMQRIWGCFLRGYMYADYTRIGDHPRNYPLQLSAYAFRDHQKTPDVQVKLSEPTPLCPEKLFPSEALMPCKKRPVQYSDMEVYLFDFLGAQRLPNNAFELSVGTNLYACLIRRKEGLKAVWHIRLEMGRGLTLPTRYYALLETPEIQEFFLLLKKAATNEAVLNLLEEQATEGVCSW